MLKAAISLKAYTSEESPVMKKAEPVNNPDNVDKVSANVSR